MLFYTFYKLVGPFVDPVTKDKIRFNPDCRTLVPPSQLDKQVFGGDFDFEYKHDEYFMHLHEMTKKKREANMERWRQYGGNKCGLSEFIIKGGNQQDETTTEAKSSDLTDNKSVLAPISNGADNKSTTASSEDLITTPALSSGFSRDQSAPTSGTSSPAQPNTPVKAFEDAQNSAARNMDALVQEGGRPRGNSTDSFVSTKEQLSPVLSATSMPNGSSSSNSNFEKLETGIAGLVIKADGSIGSA